MENKLFHEYYYEWINNYKKNVIQEVTFAKYLMTHDFILSNFPNLKLKDLNRGKYQEIVNKYGESHSETTTRDFMRTINASLKDAHYDGYLEKDATHRVVPAGYKFEREKKVLSRREYDNLSLELDKTDRIELALYTMLKTGMRFAECLGITKEDIDFDERTIHINKTFDYKNVEEAGFKPTKNKASIRHILISEEHCKYLKSFAEGKDNWFALFIKDERPYASTFAERLRKRLKEIGVDDYDKFNNHSLRHTHASILLESGVNILSISKRLGHSTPATTQKVYLHIIKELEAKDNKKILECV